MLVVEELTCRFGSKTAVDKASFAIPRGSFIGVIGRSVPPAAIGRPYIKQ